ncbi:GH25 family lysozyme [Ligilactobacillus animalis]|uniref:Phage minor structural protein, N-terminal region n=2 Tax=Bacteria TaxID=2 RepID=A0ABR4RQA3_9LACO|nr:GH25 family lysozyme [Ligilactobacillus animalis]KDA46187.1 phage minor structural protein, N-terminal region [Ligilactobacillus animalis]MEE0260820.1 GH25 family lysozyme [Ligilactobacillus animalis]PNQ52990.1 endolysin [Ligilactobacillus animalis]
MYRIIAYNEPTDKVGYIIHDPRIDRRVSAGKLTLKEGEIDDLTLKVNQKSNLFNNVRPMHTHVEVYDGNELIFRGRALKPTRTMESSGQFMQEYVFESIEAYLLDSVQRFAEVHNTTPADFFRMLIQVHNNSVPDWKKFEVRKVNVTNSTDNVYRFVDYTKTRDTIKEKLLTRLGGFLRVEYHDGKNYVDYVIDPGRDHQADTPIKLGRNLKSASMTIDPTKVITRLIPLGAQIEPPQNETGNVANGTRPRITIADLNGGKDYLDIPDLQQEFGIINGTQTWDDVHEPQNLLRKANEWIQAQSATNTQWTISALELPEYNAFKVSDRYLFINPGIVEPQMLRVTQKQIDLTKPYESSLTIAEKPFGLVEYQSKLQKSLGRVENLKRVIESQAEAISEWNARYDNSQQQIKDLSSALKDLENKVNAQTPEQPKPPHIGKIIDVSEWQGVIDWNSVVRDDVTLSIIRIQDGSSHQDLKYMENLQKCINAGGKYAVYAYFRGTSTADAQQEARDFFERTQQVVANKQQPVFYAIDVESAEMGGNISQMRAGIEAFMSQLNTLGVPDHKIVLYIANHLYDSFNLNTARAGAIWIPSYGQNDGSIVNSTKPTHPYDLWQYTSKGRVSGITGNVDMNTEPSDKFKAYLS